jgi:hypothetical protein
MSAVGEWTGWSTGDVQTIMLRSLQAGACRRTLGRIAARMFHRRLADRWRMIGQHLDAEP